MTSPTNRLGSSRWPSEPRATRPVAGHRHGHATTRSRPNWALIAGLLAAIATLVASLGGLYYNAQTVRQATVQAQLTDRAQASERFSRSIEQLGSTSEPIRTGAIYTFGGLMRDSPTDQQAIVEILSSYIRSNATSGRISRADAPDAPADVLAALAVLDGQPRPRRHVLPNGSVVEWPSMRLSRIELRRVWLREISIREADFENAHFTDVDFFETDLSGSNLRSTSWGRASLTAATLKDADLSYASLPRGDLIAANLSGARLVCTGLVEVSLFGANLHGANLRGANLRHADLTKADLTAASLTGADLRRANLSGADLSGADLSRADLRGADLTDVKSTSETRMPTIARVRNCG